MTAEFGGGPSGLRGVGWKTGGLGVSGIISAPLRPLRINALSLWSTFQGIVQQRARERR